MFCFGPRCVVMFCSGLVRVALLCFALLSVALLPVVLLCGASVLFAMHRYALHTIDLLCIALRTHLLCFGLQCSHLLCFYTAVVDLPGVSRPSSLTDLAALWASVWEALVQRESTQRLSVLTTSVIHLPHALYRWVRNT